VTFSDGEARLYVSCVNAGGLGHIYLIDPTNDIIADSIIAGHETYMSHQHAGHGH
jgi:hypothetical protein